MRFSKYHGYGNDFIIGVYKEGIDYSSLAKKICDRHTGIGADGLIMLGTSDGFEMIFYNADGTRGTMCGNGIRCLSKFIVDNNFVNKDDHVIVIKTLSGIRNVYFDNDIYTVNMGKPNYDCASFGVKGLDELFDYPIKYNDEEVKVTGMFFTTDHLVVVGDNDHDTKLGEFLCFNPFFTKGINVNFAKYIHRKEIFVETYERGVGWTLACGSGSSACFAYLNRKGLVDDMVTVHLRLGEELTIFKENDDIFMKGKAVQISNNIEYNV